MGSRTHSSSMLDRVREINSHASRSMTFEVVCAAEFAFYSLEHCSAEDSILVRKSVIHEK